MTINLCVNLKLSLWDALKLRLINKSLPEIEKSLKKIKQRIR
jgi:hypothetical protein